MKKKAIPSPHKIIRMYLVTCSCGGMLASNLGSFPFFKNKVDAEQFIIAFQPRDADGHTGSIHEISVLVPTGIIYD